MYVKVSFVLAVVSMDSSSNSSSGGRRHIYNIDGIPGRADVFILLGEMGV